MLMRLRWSFFLSEGETERTLLNELLDRRIHEVLTRAVVFLTLTFFHRALFLFMFVTHILLLLTLHFGERFFVCFHIISSSLIMLCLDLSVPCASR